jgi:hypothetical protein
MSFIFRVWTEARNSGLDNGVESRAGVLPANASYGDYQYYI